MNRASLLFFVCAVLVSANVSAELSPQYRNWGNTAVQYLMMKQERADWPAVKTDAEAKTFIDLFWARRDPTPDTPANELRAQFESRVEEADRRFSYGKTVGSQTDRGIVYALLGKPTQVVTRVAPARSSSLGMSQFQRPVNIESWVYRNEAAERVIGTKNFDIAFDFHDEKFAAEFEFDGPSQRSFESTALVIAKAVIKRPFMTAADLASGADSRTVPLRLIVVADDAIAQDVLKR